MPSFNAGMVGTRFSKLAQLFGKMFYILSNIFLCITDPIFDNLAINISLLILDVKQFVKSASSLFAIKLMTSPLISTFTFFSPLIFTKDLEIIQIQF